jgi:DNA invertase Pin-like site-specific DNA recombinase
MWGMGPSEAQRLVAVFWSASSWPSGLPIIRLLILAAVRQWERETIGERSAGTMAYKRRQSEYTEGQPPYGGQLAADGNHLAPHVDEQAITCEALELKASGLSMRKIGAHLAARGLLPRQGKIWNPKTVRDLLQAEVA